ncbi:hypothetical protein V8D89_013467 [Ganoderma adspersum]
MYFVFALGIFRFFFSPHAMVRVYAYTPTTACWSTHVLLFFIAPPLLPFPSHRNACAPTRSVPDAHVCLISCRKAARRPLPMSINAHTCLRTFRLTPPSSQRYIHRLHFLAA